MDIVTHVRAAALRQDQPNERHRFHRGRLMANDRCFPVGKHGRHARHIAVAVLPDLEKGADGLCVPKTKSERIDDEARPRWRARLWRRIAEPDERPAHPFAKTDAF